MRVGAVEGVTLTRWQRAWAQQRPDVPLVVDQVPEAEQRTALDTGAVDLCFVREPLVTDGLQVVWLYEEVAVVVVPRDHPASLYESLVLADLGAETVLDAREPADPFDLVAGGAGVLIVPQSVARARSRRDLVHRPVTDAPTTRVGLAWLPDLEHPATQDFVGVVRGRTVNSSRGTRPSAVPPPPRRPGRAPATKRGPRR